MFNRRDFIKLCSAATLLPCVPALAFNDESPEIPTILNYTKDDQVYISCLHKATDQITLTVSDPQGVLTSSDDMTKYTLPLGEHAISRFLFSRLAKNTEYNLKISSPLIRKEIFKNFLLPDLDSKKCRLAVISCTSYRQSIRGKMWDKVYASRPDVVLLIGDAVYADSVADVLLKRPASIDTFIANFIETWQKLSHYTRDRLIPSLSIWDDHDFGWNDGNGSRPQINTISEIYRNFYYVPDNSSRVENGPGISFRWDAFGSRFIFADDRSFRNYDTRASHNTCWGTEQKRWIERQIKESPNKNIFLINGSQFQTLANQGDGVSNNHMADYNWILNLAATVANKKVVLISGDVHYSSIQKIRHQNRDIFEITSSCLHCTVAGERFNRHSSGGQLAYYGDQNFVLLEVDSTSRFSISATCISKSSNKQFSLKFEA